MNVQRTLWLAASLTLGAVLARGGISYTCDANIDATVAGTCSTLNTTIAGLYSSTFSNANASIFIQYGTTGLGSSTPGFDNQISYADYLADLASTASSNAVDTAALASLPVTEPALYGGAPVDISSALGMALGRTSLNGTTAGGSLCTVGTAGCYNGIITITNDPSTLLYYRTGVQNPDSYDFYSVVEHETDELLGTTSCVNTTGASLANGCPNNAAAAVDLFRYSSGALTFIDNTPGAYFSYNGGVTNGAGGALYNTLANGDDYADFLTGCPSAPRIQDGTGCPGFGGLDITNDGRPEITILDTVGYNLNTVPEPSTVALLGAGFAFLAVCLRRRRA